MKIKHVVTAVLLLFVVGSVAYMMIQERKAAAVPTQPAVPQTVLKSQAAAPARQVIVYYFHGDVRCQTCHKLETYARQAVQAGFAEEIKVGLVVWKAVNVDRPENAHFVTDYKLVTKSVIVSEVLNGKETGWKNLDRIWELVGNQEAYLEYIRTHVKTFLEKESS